MAAVSAEGFLAELRRDPAYVQSQDKQEAYRAEKESRIRELDKPVLDDLSRIGVQVDRLEDLPPRHAPLSQAICEVLLRWVKSSTESDLLEQLVRALAATRVPYDGRPLIAVFENASSEYLRWAVANTLACTTPLGIDEWIGGAVLRPNAGMAREMLVRAMARRLPKAETNSILLSVFDEIPYSALLTLAKTGGERELRFLESRQSLAPARMRRPMDRAIERIRKKLDRALTSPQARR